MQSRYHFIIILMCLLLDAKGNYAYANCDQGERIVRFSYVTSSVTHPKALAAKQFSDEVNNRLNGVMCIELYPNAVLFNDDSEIQALLIGDVQLLARSLSKFGDYTKKLSVFDLPFIFDNLDAAIRFSESNVGQDLLRSMEDAEITGLGYWMSGMKYFSANIPIYAPSDLEGLHIRIQPSEISHSIMGVVGAIPQPTPFTAIFSSLESGKVDGQENTWSNIYTKGFYRVQDGTTETGHQLLAYLFMTSTTFLDSLKDDVRNKFITIAREVTLRSNRQVESEEMKNRMSILDRGGVIRTFTPQQREQWVETMRPIWRQFEGVIGRDIIEAAKRSNTVR